MQEIVVKTREEQKQFIKFRKKIYKSNSSFVDNNLFTIKQLFSNKTCFADDKEVIPIYIEDDNFNIKCECIVVYTKKLPEYIQLCFFESEDNSSIAVKMLVDKVIQIGKKYGCTKLVIGLNGHVNYGLGLLNSHFDIKNSFGVSGNPSYYNKYFKELKFDEVLLNTYTWSGVESKVNRFSAIISKINRAYSFKILEKDKLEYYSKIYTDLNNKCFPGHRYYYNRTYKEDKEMLKEMLLFVKPESLIFAFKDDEPVAFILWYPDFNELVLQGEAFGIKTYFKNLFFNRKFEKAKIVEIGILEDYRKSGLAFGLINQVVLKINKYGIKKGESSWILEENVDSNSICKAICDDLYKEYVVYEKDR
ncbi:MAG: GNAT family N-acetyltransferase [Defluviitaleaceae bacterium]|nr:GNAT family N-acetyltransferase [Defluviitaleaceae bacterium]